MKKLAAALIWLLACGDNNASVGSTQCTIANACQALVVDTPLRLTPVGTRDIVPREATWTFVGEPRITYGIGGIARAANGGVWAFVSDGNTLVAKSIDGDARVVGEQRVAAPAGAASRAMVRSVSSHASGPVLHVLWAAGDCGPRLPLGACGRSELLVFGNDVAAPVQRINADALYRKDHNVEAVYRASGDSLFIPSLDDGFSKIDLQGRLLWKQPFPDELTRSELLLYALGKPDESAALDADGALMLNVNWFPTIDGASPGWRGVLLHQPADGSPSMILQYTVPTSGDVLTLKQGYQSFYAHDPRGRHLLVHEIEDGDIAVLRLDGTSADGYRLLRDDYRELAVDATALDPAGTLHVALNGGGRQERNPVPVLCSFPMDGAPQCSVIAFRPGGMQSMQAPAPGAVFILGPGGLVRYDRAK